MSKFKIGWGTGITIFICLWIGGIIGFVIFSFGFDIHLVEEDYYPKEEQYQQKIDQLSRSKSFDQDIRINQTTDSLGIQFPSEVADKTIDAAIHFYRPSTPDLDRHDTITIQQPIFALPKSNFEEGKYTVKIEWSVDSTSYYFTKDIHVRK